MKKNILSFLLIMIITLNGCESKSIINENVKGNSADSTQSNKTEYNLKTQIDNAKSIDEYDINTKIDDVDTIKFGKYPQNDVNGELLDDIEWIVLKKDGNKAYLMSKYILDFKEWNRSGQDCTYEESSIRKWLNNDFYSMALEPYDNDIVLESSISNEERMLEISQKGFVEHHVETADNKFNDKVSLLGLKDAEKYFGANDLYSDKAINMISTEELNNVLISTGTTKYSANIGKDELRKNGEPTYYSAEEEKVIEYKPEIWFYGNQDYWLKSKSTTMGTKVNIAYELVMPYGLISASQPDNKNGVRPTIWVKY